MRCMLVSPLPVNRLVRALATFCSVSALSFSVKLSTSVMLLRFSIVTSTASRSFISVADSVLLSILNLMMIIPSSVFSCTVVTLISRFLFSAFSLALTPFACDLVSGAVMNLPPEMLYGLGVNLERVGSTLDISCTVCASA